jgi:hypothetical protein
MHRTTGGDCVATTASGLRKDDAPEFFGRDTRYIHRIYGGVIINMR